MWNNQQVGSVQSTQSYLVQRRSTQVVPLTLSLTRDELNGALRDAFSNLQNFLSGIIRISGTMNVGADFIKINDYPFDYQETAANLVGYSLSSIIR